MSMPSKKQRHRARQLLVQAFYQWHMNSNTPIEIELQFQEEHDMSRIDRVYFTKVLNDVINQMAAIDGQITPELDRDIAELNPVELSVLRLATYELWQQEDIPFKVVINEALNLTKLFGSEDGHKYVNGVLDVLAKKLRPLETKVG